jgi:hypothetical protein
MKRKKALSNVSSPLGTARCQARLCRNFGGRLEWREGKGLDLGCGPRACPAGATELSPGFQPWEPSKLTVRPERARDAGTDEARTLLPRQRQSAQLERAAIGLLICFRLLRTFDLAPLRQGASLWVVGSQGQNPGLNSVALRGH